MNSDDEYYYNEFMESSSDDDSDDEYYLIADALAVEDEDVEPRYKGSMLGHEVIDRERAEGHVRLYKDYFAPNPVYDPAMFRRRFRMARGVFMRIVNAVKNHDDYFKLKRDCTGKLGFSSLQKCTGAIRMLAYGTPADAIDEYLRMSESTCLEAMVKFCSTVVKVFGPEYLRAPNAQDIEILKEIGNARGFPRMLGCIGCMHWEWKNCPYAWQGQYQGHVGEPTIILEAVASYDLWICHSFFGMPGSHNEINVLQRSPLFARLAEGKAPECNFEINGHNYTMGYYLVDGIYPQWATFVKTISNPQGNKRAIFAKMQEGARKDVKQAFGVLQSRWAIVRGPARIWDAETLWEVMTACVIMHNMIVENEHEGAENVDFDYVGEIIQLSEQEQAELEYFLEMHRKIRDREMHHQLLNDLVEHMWAHHGNL